MRASSYNIYVALNDDTYLIIQGYTGAVDKINAQVNDYLVSGGKIRENISELTIKTLIDRGYLTDRSPEEEREQLKRIAEIYHNRILRSSNFIFAPTFSCQFRCVYCYESPVAHREGPEFESVMKDEHVQSAYNAIDKITKDFKKNPPKEITLYGGEPLIAKNYDIIRSIVDEGIKRKFKISAITNGYDLVNYEPLLGKNKINSLQITIDGPEEIHNRRRFVKGGLPTFQKICSGIQIALDKGCIVNLRTNVDNFNISNLMELVQFYFEKGWSKNPRFRPYVFITDQYGKLEPMELINGIEKLFNTNIVNSPIKFNPNFSERIASLIRSNNIPPLTPDFCGATSGSCIFGPDGYIYACWQAVGLPENRIGGYYPKLEWNEEISGKWLNRYISNLPECLDCPYALICGGGCPTRAKRATGSMYNHHCFQFQEVFQHILPMIYQNHFKSFEEKKDDQATVDNNITCA